MIAEADRDGDGEVNQQEFLRIMKKTCLYWKRHQGILRVMLLLYVFLSHTYIPLYIYYVAFTLMMKVSGTYYTKKTNRKCHSMLLSLFFDMLHMWWYSNVTKSPSACLTVYFSALFDRDLVFFMLWFSSTSWVSRPGSCILVFHKASSTSWGWGLWNPVTPVSLPVHLCLCL